MTGDEVDDEDHIIAPVPKVNHEDDHKDFHKDDHKDNPEDDPQVISTKKPPAVGKATFTKPAEVVIFPPQKKCPVSPVSP
jgi:hypothetical protein